MKLPQTTVQLLIRILGAIAFVGEAGALLMAIAHRPESAAVAGLAHTALGGLIGLLVNPEQEKERAQ